MVFGKHCTIFQLQENNWGFAYLISLYNLLIPCLHLYILFELGVFRHYACQVLEFLPNLKVTELKIISGKALCKVID